MRRPRKSRRDWDLEMVGEVSDDLWAQLAPVIKAVDLPELTGRKRVDAYTILTMHIFHLRNGCQ
jgi:hypothetical protein